jgi:predicted O-linked N-acetylglucosamine transferase (SPINDLY family)
MNRKERRAESKHGKPTSQGSAAVADLLKAAVQFHSAGRLNDAEPLYRQVLQLDSKHVDTLHLLGVLSHQLGRHEIAAEFISKAIVQNSRVAPFHNSLGNALQACGRPIDAQASYDRALALKPDYPEAHRARGTIFQAQGQLEEAIAAYGRALALKPQYAEAHLNLGNAFLAQGKLDEAAGSYRQALAIKPDLVEALNNLGNALQMRGKLDEAIASYRDVLKFRPDFAEVHSNLGTALREQGKAEDAITSYRHALTHRPNLAEAHSNLLMTLHYIDGISNAELLNAALAFGKTFDKTDLEPLARISAADPKSERRLRIGYVSGDFIFHPVGYFLARVLPAHDKNEFEVFCYSNNTATDAMTDRLRSACEHWRSIAGIPDAEAAALIQRDEIDILIDLSGHTARNRLLLFALRPAPLQVSWLGYFGTTGLAAMDYIVMDADSVPPDHEHWYSEKIIRLPHMRFCYDSPEAIAAVEPPCLKNGSITFGSFNNIAKIGSQAVSLWAEILRATPNARLVLKWKSLDIASSQQRLRDAFAAAGIDPGRVEFRGASPHREMLAEYADIDIALDPFPFGGGLTSCEALWMGVPVITLPGDTPASRQTLGFLRLLKLDDLAVVSRADYVARAVDLAANPQRLAILRQNLRPLMAASPLCDGVAFTAGLEQAFLEIWQRHTRGKPPIAFDVPPLNTEGHIS